MFKSFLNAYPNFQENIPNRYFPPALVEELIQKNNYTHDVLGRSFQNRPIYRLRMGNGKFKILLWAQMHGNESTASRAMFDFWKLIQSNDDWVHNLLQVVTIDFIPQLNPDGAHVYTRRNAAQIDINRDFVNEQTPEMQTLKKLVIAEDYDLLFNLHDQRTIFNPKGQKLPATLSFLAPAIDETDAMPDNRKFAVQMISCILQELEYWIPNQIGRFSHEFYPKATGDNFQRLGYPIILIECGHYPDDYQRNMTRKFTYFSIIFALEAIVNQRYKNADTNIYFNTPENDQKALDIIYKGVQIKNEFSEITTDLGIQFEEKWEEGKPEISFIAKIHAIGDLSDCFGHDICHAENRVFENNQGNIPNIGELANFNLEDWIIENGKKL